MSSRHLTRDIDHDRSRRPEDPTGPGENCDDSQHREPQGASHADHYARTDVILLVQDLHVTVVNAATGEILRDLTIDPRHDYQPTGRPPGPTKN